MYTKCPLKPPKNIYYPPITIGHRGTSFYIPEHTLAGYRLALELGTDYIEPDLVPTKDNVLIAMHDIDLNITTNVGEVFPNRYRLNVTHDDKTRSGYFTQDFTLDEIKQLRVKQRIEDTPARSRYFDWEFDIPTLDEIIDLLYEWNYNITSYIYNNNNASIPPPPKAGLYAELKHPQWIYDDSSIQVSDLLLNNLRDNKKANTMFFNDDCITSLQSEYKQFMVPPLVLQCFEIGTLSYLRQHFIDNSDDFDNNIPPNVYLVSQTNCNTSKFFKTLHKYKDIIDGIGPDKSCILNNADNNYVKSVLNTLGSDSVVHPWTERLEIEFVNSTFTHASDELKYLFCTAKIDGIFAENVDISVRVSRESCDNTFDTNSVRTDILCSSFSSSMEWMRFVQGAFMGTFVAMVISWFVFGKSKREHRFHTVDDVHNTDIIT